MAGLCSRPLRGIVEGTAGIESAKRGLVACCLFALIYLPVQEAAAFRADGEQASKAITTATKPSARALSGTQQRLAGLARQSGLSVRWDTELGTPLSVRGSDLGVSASFSSGKGMRVSAQAPAFQNAVAVLDNLSGMFGIADATREFALKREAIDTLGFKHVRLHQLYKGLRVVGGDLIVHFDKTGKPYEVNGRYVPGIDAALAPAITPDGATGIAKKDLASAGVAGEVVASSPVLIIYAVGSVPALAYETTLSAGTAKGPGLWRYVVGAANGAVLRRYSDIQRIAPPTGNGNDSVIQGNILTGEGGAYTNATGWYENTGAYYLYNKNLYWYIYNVATSGWPDNNTYAYRSTGDWGNSDPAEMSGAVWFDRTQQYFLTVHGRSSFDNASTYAVANIHEGVSLVNAYYDGSDFHFGDGDGASASALVVVDVVAHEFAHGVTDYSADLVYAYEPGALNESFSDIFGACVEFYSQPDGRASYPGRTAGHADWLMGEDCWLSSTALRDMRSPTNSATVGAGGEQPSRYLGSYWYSGDGDNGGVHYNSGVQNFFFYLLCEGGVGNNDGIGYNLTGIGIGNAERIAYRALTVYCGPNTDYRAARSAWLSAAADLNAAWVAPVSAAWDAVGVSAFNITPRDGVAFAGEAGGPFSPASQSLTLVNDGTTPLNWVAQHTEGWCDITPLSGTIAGGGSDSVVVTINAGASALPDGIHEDSLTFSNSVSAIADARIVSLRIGQPDHYTEEFTDLDYDLENSTLTFTPDGSASHYSACIEPATQFPTDPATATLLPLDDDEYAEVVITGFSVLKLYGTNYGSVFVGSNGYITFGDGDTDLSGGLSDHFRLPRIAALFTDLNPSAAGTVSTEQFGDRFVVTFENVPQYGMTDSNSFQYELFFDGTVRITYLAMGAADGTCGLSAGEGLPQGFFESDLSSYGSCVPPDGLQVSPDSTLQAIGYLGGPFAPSSITYTVSNIDTQHVVWSASGTEAWVTVSPGSGVLAPTASTNVSVSINAFANTLGLGSYSDLVVFSNAVSGVYVGRAVALNVSPIPGEIEVLDSIAPTADLSMPFGDVIAGLSRGEQVTIRNTDGTHALIISDISFGAYDEDFDDGLAQDWEELTDLQWQVVNGEYRAEAGATALKLQSTYTGELWEDCLATATLRRSGDDGSAARLICRASADFSYPDATGDAYLIAISGEGSYYVGKYLSGTFAFLQEWTSSPLLNTAGAANTVAVNIVGDLITVYFNGNMAWSGTDSSITGPGRVGVIAWSGTSAETVHYVDNVSVADPAVPLRLLSDSQQWYNARPAHNSDPESAPKRIPVPAEQEIPLTDPGDVIADATLTGGPWSLGNLPTFPYSLPPGATLVVDVGFNPTAVGAVDRDLSIVSNDDDENEVIVALSGTGIADYLAVTPESGLASSGHPGGPFTPTSIDYTLRNISAAPISWQAALNANWLQLSTSSGTLPVGNATTVTVSLATLADALPEGDYSDVISFSNLTTTITQTRDASLHIFTTPQILVTPAIGFNVTNRMGQVQTRTMVVSNAAAADGSLEFSVRTRETGRSILSMAAAGVGIPAKNRDFTTVAEGAQYRADRILVRFAAGFEPAHRETLLVKLGGRAISRQYDVVPGLCLVDLDADVSVKQALLNVDGVAGILYAQPDYIWKAERTPNDSSFSDLWGMHNTGQTGGTPDADIDAPEAWDVVTGDPGIIVAVIDTGVDYNHPDLDDNMWVNTAEIPTNGIDDDNNGYVDDVYGYDAVNNDGDPMDDHYHGTHCAGSVGAEGGNAEGVVGVCWNVRIMALKFLSSSGSGSTADAITCIQYAIQMEAKVLSNSWGGGPFDQALKDAIDAADALGIPFIAAAGNDGTDNDSAPHYPSSYTSENIIAVVNSDHNDNKAGTSCYGLISTDLAAPGSSILSCEPGGGYQYLGGTSMATPHVAGACALMLAINPLLEASDMKQILMDTVDPTLPGVCVSGGRMNLANAIASTGVPWLSADPDEGTDVMPGTSSNVVIAFDASETDAGTYTGEVVVVSNDPLTPTVTLPALMTVLPDDLRISPSGSFDAQGEPQGPYSPLSMQYQLSNSSPAVLTWVADCEAAWMDLTPSSGTLPGGRVISVAAHINSSASLLGYGLHRTEITFVNQVNSVTQRRQVSLSLQPPTPVELLCFDLSNDPGWATEGEWAYGQPLGVAGDPSSGHTGNNVYGYALDGEYTNDMPVRALTTTVIDCRGFTNVNLTFWRWLGVEDGIFDSAAVEVSNDGLAWQPVWDNADAWTIEDMSWQQQSYDISAVADGAPAVYVRWTMGPTDGSVTYCGWNLDDVCLYGSKMLSPMYVPIDWLIAHGITNGGSWAVAEQMDDDLDGMAAWQEYFADTDPRDPASYLAIMGVNSGSGFAGVAPLPMTVIWQGGVDAVQYLECRDSLVSTNETWHAIFTNMPPTTVSNTVIDGSVNGTGQRFYRIRVTESQ